MILVVAIVGMMAPDNSQTGVESVDESSGSTGTESDIVVEDLQVVSEGYGSYSVKGKITPSIDFSYLEMHLKWYDSEGNLLYDDPLAWNINNAKAGQTVKFSAVDYIDTGTPSKVEVMIFDSLAADDSSAIYRTTVNV
ncbi:unknown [Methanothermobacter thermautotrophicus str. Delta H]|uniref:DUF3426 domain-containing protein n=1 Tax=Methanothermobacter thermautotrophicus (strain ATCC 29096 / DSM 1053 / JCM 10044 / NBRC 100330 / Delta H) TaxID=187420 RepID=O26619_METTH|nr:hypothetical protein [Methanothermobacter thermautotrophicus]AAB85025.1 unknown [Methanothermobacter thermautotrophicus str. Delta H]